MRAMKIFFFFPICFACVLSCASVPKKEILFVNLTDSSKFVLLPTVGIEQTIDMVQFFSTEFRGQNYFCNVWVIANESVIEMYFFNEMGASIGELSYRNGAANFSSTVIPKSVVKYIKPENVIADFQLCFYEPILLGKSLKDSGLVLENSDGYRRILSGNEVIIDIKKTEGTVELVNILRGYAYTLEGDFHEIRN